MSNVSQISYTLYTLHLLITTVKRLMTFIIGKLTGDRVCDIVAPVINDSIDKIEKIFDQGKASPFTELLLEKDRQRDNLFLSIYRIVQGNLTLPLEQESKAASVLMKILEKYGTKMVRKSYSEESFLIGAFLKEIDTPEVEAAINTLHLRQQFDLFTQAQTDFENTYKQKVDTEVDEQSPLISELRKELIFNVEGLRGYVDLMAHHNIAGFTELATPLNQIIGESMTIARAAKTRTQNANTSNNEQELITENPATVS